MAIIANASSLRSCHCGLVPHQSKSINQASGFRRNNPADNSTTKS